MPNDATNCDVTGEKAVIGCREEKEEMGLRRRMRGKEEEVKRRKRS